MASRYFNLQREISTTAIRLERGQSPRLHMFLIVALACATGFLTTFVLLQLGVGQLWLRYACAVSLAYGAFLGLVWFWLHVSRDDLSDFPDFSGSSPPGSAGSGNPPDVDFSPGGGQFGGGGASSSFDGNATPISFASDSGELSSTATSSLPDVGIADVGDAGEALPLVAVIAAVVGVIALLGAVLTTASIVWGAPTFLGELLVDIALARGLYRHMIGAYDRYWLKTALRHTFRPFLGLLVLLMIAGALMQAAVPNVVSIGQFIHYFTESP